jgi:drug/metabolite transporter (DMT)-like permease
MSTVTVSVARRPSAGIALAWMCGALAAFTLVAIAGREAGRVVSTPQMMMWRGLLSLAIMLVALALSGRGGSVLRTRAAPLHLFRNTVHFGAQFAWLYALASIPLAELFALEFTAPLWIAVLAPLVLAERLTAWRLAAAVLGFAGTLVVVFMPATATAAPFTLNAGTAFALLSAIGFAVSLMSTKRLTRSESVPTILAWMALIQSVYSAFLIPAYWVLPDAATLGWLAVLAACGLAAHYSIAQAFARADAIIVAPMDFLRLPLIAFVGAQLYGETLDRWVLIGGLIVIAANAINMWGERRSQPA